MRKLIVAFLLVSGVSLAHDRVFFSLGVNLGAPHYCPERIVYVERPVVYRPYYPPPVYYVPVERVIIIHKHKHWKHWKDWDD
ncbi:hypothetical protein [Hydrogenobacter hydrogenophilus]|uniref:PXPV repeat-containing protein n=1 Tax=Hydrogenobacter hydrogenophilus TaxID=35835 RepID=A0A285P5T2_9AQUI|nr:hypothetical protein [Hydrogenobacter hydrogenophilus]SNZ16523.1 hypothetical protein SAMN06265353_1628 [Hydrogenobacter hydrogenophilus]